MNRKQSPIGSYPAHWNLVTIDSVALLKHGYQFRTYDFTKEGIKVFKITQIKSNGTIDISSCDHIDISRLESFANFIICKGDILMALSGATIGKIARFNSTETVLQNYRVGNFLPIDDKILSKNYFYYFLTTEYIYQQILANQTQSAQENVGKEDIHKMFLFLPPLSEQTCIAEVLGGLDDKINLLHRQNKTLEQLAETLFRHWFVEEAEESWEMVRVSDFAYINKLTISRNYPFTVIEYLDTGSITEGVIENFEIYNLSDAPSRAQRIVKDNDIIYSLVRPIQRHYGLLNNVMENTVVSTGFCVITSKEVNPYFLYLLLTRNEAIDYFDMIAEGSTSTYPSLKPSDIANFEFKKPPEEKLNKFNKVSSDTLNKIKSNTNQIKTLTQLRETLLPKLMSGEVRVKLN